MNEPVEDRLRRVLSATALREVPDSTPIPSRRMGDELGPVRSRRMRPWFAPVLTGMAAALIAVVATVIVVQHSDEQSDAGPGPVVATSASASTSSASTSSVSTTAPTVPPTTAPTVAPALVVPNLVGLGYDRTVIELTRLGLKPVRHVVDGTQPVDVVVGIAPAAGSRVSPGTSVVLRVSNNQLFVVPKLANRTPAAAAAALQALGWKGSVTTLNRLMAPTMDTSLVGLISGSTQNTVGPTYDSGFPVPGQTPAAGTTANKAVGITVVVYGKKQIPVPSFTPEVTRFQDIEKQMSAAGFTAVTYDVVTPANPPNVPGTFISITGAAAGDVADFDTPITITVWGAAPVPTTPTTPAIPETPTTTR